MININSHIQPADLLAAIERMWSLSADRLRRIEGRWKLGGPSPVITVDGKYQVGSPGTELEFAL